MLLKDIHVHIVQHLELNDMYMYMVHGVLYINIVVINNDCINYCNVVYVILVTVVVPSFL